jgi:hypothetical protein
VIEEAQSKEENQMTRQVYAKVWWSVDDVSEEARENDINLTKDEAHQLLESIEKRLEETMIGAGWTVIQDALSEKELSRNAQVARS